MLALTLCLLLSLTIVVGGTRIGQKHHNHKHESSGGGGDDEDDDSSSSSSSDTTQPPPPATTHCLNCAEDGNQHGPLGACCFGDRSLGNDYSKERCAYYWAGANTTDADCTTPHPCCYPEENGKCTIEHCFTCYNNDGIPVKDCKECHAPRTTTVTTRRESATTTKKHHHPKPTPPSKGCCCSFKEGHAVRSAEECHECGGSYKGDGSTCDEDDDICEERCCADGGARTCGVCTGDDWRERFVGYGDDVCVAEVCGVTCCINARAVNAASTEQCVKEGGTSYPNVALADAHCGGGCCNRRTLAFTITSDSIACEESLGNDANFLGLGVGFSPGVCGGCGCIYGDGVSQRSLTSAECANDVTCVYQGDGVQCGNLVLDDYSSSSDSSDSSESSSSSSTAELSSSSDSEDDGDAELNRALGQESSSSSSSSSLSVIEFEKIAESSVSAASSSVSAGSLRSVASRNYSLCANDGCCCLGHGRKEMMRDSLACFEASGVWKGEGSRCETCDCRGGVCCYGKAGKIKKNAQTCKLDGGVWTREGTTLDMPGVCDRQGGACVCGTNAEQCLEVPNATVCFEFGCGIDAFQGVGTTCSCGGECGPTQSLVKSAGSCCVPHKYERDVYTCELVATAAECQLMRGAFNKDGRCDDDTCRDVKGTCCTKRDETCFDCEETTSYECGERKGKWGGMASLCSDEYACDKNHVGACCRVGHACSVTSAKECHREGGKFQGFKVKCHDDGCCKDCAPCLADAPPCSETRACANPHATCVREYGKCMVLAKHLATKYTDAWVPKDDDDDDDDDDAQPLLITEDLRKRQTEQPPATPAATSDDDDDDDDSVNVGPLSCGDESTLGMPCLASPILGKCRIGTCERPPFNGTLNADCRSVCRSIREYDCGCKCEGEWKKTCGVVMGRVLQDVDQKRLIHDAGNKGVIGATVQISRKRDGDGHYKPVSRQTTASGGHYAFSSLEPGKYEVHIHLPGCLTTRSTDERRRFVEVECLENAERKMLAPTSAKLEKVGKATHLAENIDFLVFEDCKQAIVDNDSDGDAHNHDDDDDGDESKRGTSDDEQSDDRTSRARRGDNSDAGEDDDDSSRRRLSRGGVVVLVVLGFIFLCVCLVVCIGRNSRGSNSNARTTR